MKRTPYRMVRVDLETYMQLAAGLKPFETVTGAVNLAVQQEVMRRTIKKSVQDMARTEDIDAGVELV